MCIHLVYTFLFCEALKARTHCAILNTRQVATLSYKPLIERILIENICILQNGKNELRGSRNKFSLLPLIICILFTQKPLIRKFKWWCASLLRCVNSQSLARLKVKWGLYVTIHLHYSDRPLFFPHVWARLWRLI